MKIQKLLLLTFAVMGMVACNNFNSQEFISENVNFAKEQIWNEVETINKTGEVLNPRTINEDGTTRYVEPHIWTSGFFPGSLWYMYELTNDEKWVAEAQKITESLDTVQYLKWHHDVGFMVYCSYGNGYRLTGNEDYKKVIIQAAKSLSTRFRPGAGAIQSWDANKGWQAKRGWQCPVIIDNMMNLELLFQASEFTGDNSYRDIAIKHAETTMKHHFRKDYSSYHVIDYDLKTGSVRHKHTAQGFAHESAWSRGQGWALYGYTVCYRATKDKRFLDMAKNIASYLMKHPRMPKDKIPYWDFDADKIPNTPRDASAAAVIASALYELTTYCKNDDKYKKYADDIMISLASENYRAKLGENNNFLLMHSVGSIPHGAEIDVPLSYADYYFLEALTRMKKL